MFLNRGFARISGVATVINEIIASSWPRLWNVQTHIAVAGCIIGILLSLVIVGATTWMPIPGTRVPMFWTLISFQLAITIVWAWRVIKISRPAHVVEYRNSPLCINIVVHIALIMSGALALFITDGNFFERDVVSLVTIESVMILVGGRLLAVAGGIPPSGGAVTLGALVIVVATATGSVAGIGILGISLGAACMLIAAAYRLALSFLAGRRTFYDDCLAILSYIVPVATAFAWAAVRMKAQTFFHTGAQVDLDNGSLADKVLPLVALVGCLLWADLFGWVLARFYLLPKAGA